MIKVSKLEKYGIELVEDDHTLQVFGHKVVIGFASRDINTLDRASLRDIYVSVRNARTCTSIDEINSDDVVIGLWTHWRPSMQWLVQQELAGCKNDSEYFGESIPTGIPTETPEEKLALDAIEKKSPYDVGAHCSGLDKPVFTKAMADAGEFKSGDFVSVLPPKGVKQSKAKFLLIGFDLMGDAIIQHCCSKNISDVCKSRLIAPVDARTEREKAIDELVGEWPHACKSTIELMLDADYHK